MTVLEAQKSQQSTSKLESSRKNGFEELKKKEQSSVVSSLTNAVHRVLGTKISRELECYRLETELDNPQRLPFSQVTLRRMLKELTVPGQAWIDYLSLAKDWRLSVDRVTLTLNKAHHSPRKYEGFHLHDNPDNNSFFLLIFFSVGNPVKPIYLRTPSNGVQMFTFASCSSWNVGYRWNTQYLSETNLVAGHAGTYSSALPRSTSSQLD